MEVMKMDVGMALAIAAGAGILANWIAGLLKSWLMSRTKPNRIVIQRSNHDISLMAHLMRRAGFGASREGEQVEISTDVDTNLESAVKAGVEQLKRKILLDMLQDPKYQFGREFVTLKKAIASDDEETRRLLFEVGARPNIRSEGRDTWTLHH